MATATHQTLGSYTSKGIQHDNLLQNTHTVQSMPLCLGLHRYID